MKPYYEDGQSTIYLGDCSEVLPQLDKVDLVLTDPPYGIGESNEKNLSRGNLAIPKNYGAYDWDRQPIKQELMINVCSAGLNAIIFGGNYYRVMPSSCWLVWDKENGNNDFADCELAWTNLKKAVRIFRYRWNGMLQKHMGANKEARFHPTQKPVELMKWCITQAGNDVKTILDPFMGSGTTLLAAKQMGCQAIGIEQEQKYCDIAIERLRQGVLF